jgi:hypothetical protein
MMEAIYEAPTMGEMPEEMEAAVAEVEERYGELPAYRLLAFADFADSEYQYASVILVYREVEDAQTALEVIPQRIQIAPSFVQPRPLVEAFEDRGAELTSTVMEDEETGLSAAVFVWRYDHPSTEPDEAGLYLTPGLAFRLFQQMLYSVDTMWLAYDFE